MNDRSKTSALYTYNDYVHWEGRWEIIHGIAYDMSASYEPKHQFIAGVVSSEFTMALKKQKRLAVYLPVDYKVKDDTVIQPDILISLRNIEKEYLDFPPHLVIEVLSPSTADKDRYVKYPIYESQSIPYYLMIEPESKEIEVYEYKNGRYQLMQKGKGFTYTFLFNDCNATIDFGEV